MKLLRPCFHLCSPRSERIYLTICRLRGLSSGLRYGDGLVFGLAGVATLLISEVIQRRAIIRHDLDAAAGLSY